MHRRTAGHRARVDAQRRIRRHLSGGRFLRRLQDRSRPRDAQSRARARKRRHLRFGQRQPRSLRDGRPRAGGRRPRLALTADLAARADRSLAGRAAPRAGRCEGGDRLLSRIEDYGLIGDCETAALVGRDGSVDWLCWPRFDSPACFAALLGTPEHGRWILHPADDVRRSTRRYRDHSLILETTFETDSGAVTLVDFMPPRGDNSDVVRLVRGESGRVRMAMELVLRFDYGSIVPWVSRLADGTWRAIAGPDMVVLHTPVKLTGRDFTTVAEFDVGAGETVPFVLTYGASHKPPPKSIDPLESMRGTEAFWKEWASRATAEGEWCDAVHRSLMVLKALTYAPTGGIVAAVTTSLPEQIGGARNWDYRFCWLRDATLTLLALMQADHVDEALAWRSWLLRAVAGDPADLQIMYGVAGERRLTELELPWLRGYEGSAPVRIGNAASEQLQVDVYGEVMDALYQARAHGLPKQQHAWALQRTLLRYLERAWSRPDQGIWEIRDEPKHFVHSKVMAWVAFDRAVRSVEEHELDGPVDRWRGVRDSIHAEVCERGYDDTL